MWSDRRKEVGWGDVYGGGGGRGEVGGIITFAWLWTRYALG